MMIKNKQLSDILFILWAGGAALLSYSLVYALRKPYTAAAFEGVDILRDGLQGGSYDHPDSRLSDCQVLWY